MSHRHNYRPIMLKTEGFLWWSNKSKLYTLCVCGKKLTEFYNEKLNPKDFGMKESKVIIKI